MSSATEPGGAEGATPAGEREDEWDDHGEVDGGTARSVLTYVVRNIVDDPDAVQIEASETRQGIKLSVHVASGDVGKVIGRGGRLAQAIRAVVRAAGASEGADVVVDIVD